MSSIRKIVDANGETDLTKLSPVLREYENKLADWEQHLTINQKLLQQALSEHHGWAAYYDQIKVELWSLVKHFELEIGSCAGDVYEVIKENSKLDHQETGIKRMIAKHPQYLMLNRLKLEIEELHEKADSISKQFYQRAFTLRNYLKMVELEAEDITITS